MTYLETFILGLVQGLGEFLPISSSAHLIIAPWIFGFKDPGVSYSVALHLGTLLAVLFYFFNDFKQMLLGSVKYVIHKNEAFKSNYNEVLYLILATLPAAVAGFLLEDYADLYLRHPLIPAFTMTFLGVFLWQADNKASSANVQKVTLPLALMIGVSQALALIPGVSRSGITLTTALFLGLSRERSARFSFLLSTPIILGACLLKISDIGEIFHQPQAWLGFVTSAIVGFLSIKYLMIWIKKASFKIFCVYRFLFSAFVFFYYFIS